MPIAVAVLLVASSFAVLVLMVAAEALKRLTMKPHYSKLLRQWSRAAAILAAAAVAHTLRSSSWRPRPAKAAHCA